MPLNTLKNGTWILVADGARAILMRNDGSAVPWDVEFGFAGGDLVLFQIRPLVAKGAARADMVLRTLAPPKRAASKVVDLALKVSR